MHTSLFAPSHIKILKGTVLVDMCMMRPDVRVEGNEYVQLLVGLVLNLVYMANLRTSYLAVIVEFTGLLTCFVVISTSQS